MARWERSAGDMGVRGRTVVLLAVSLLLFAGCKQEGEVVVRVNHRALTLAALEEMIPPEIFFQMSKEQKEEFAKGWIETELLYQEALSRGIGKEDRIRLMVEEAEKQILINEILGREMEEVSDEEVEEYFQLHEEDYSVTVKIAHILLPTEEEAQEVLKKLAEGEKFSKLAEERSADRISAEQGGALGYKKKGDGKWTALEDVAFGLKKGETSGVVRSDYGFHIVKLLDRSPLEKKVTLDDVREEIRMTLSGTKQRERVTTWLAELRKKAKIEEHYEVLK